MSNARDIADAGHQLAAWVNFNGTGTVAIRASYNVASINDNGTGDYTVNFENAMPDANYAVLGTSCNDNTNGFRGMNAVSTNTGSQVAGSCRVWTAYGSQASTGSNGAKNDMTEIYVAIFR